MIRLVYVIVFILALVGGFFGALAGEVYTAKVMAAKVDELWPGATGPSAPVLKVVKPQKPSKREEIEWKDAPGPFSPTAERRRKNIEIEGD